MDKQPESDVPTESELSVLECKDAMDELEVIHRHEMIDQPLKKQINVVCQKKINNVSTSDESTILLYNAVEQSTMNNIDKPTKMKLDYRFLEVLHSDGSENYYDLASARRRIDYFRVRSFVQSKS